MRARPWLRIAGIALACLSVPAWGFDLLTAYRDALANDANFLAARSAVEAARESLPQARAGLLPVVTASTQRTYNETVNRQLLAPGQTFDTRSNYRAESGSISLRQPLYRKYNWAQLSLAEAQVAAAEANFEKDRQDAGLRVAGAYFDVLLAQSQVRALQVQLEALAGQQKLAERAFVAGSGTRTDIDESRARALQARAALVDASYILDNNRRTLSALVGKTPSALADVAPARLGLVPADPLVLEHWLQQMEAANPELATLRRQVEMARQGVERERAGHFPTLDLIAARQYGANESNISIDRSYFTNYVGVQLSVPIFSGGGVLAAVRQAEANLDKARHLLEAGRRRLGVDTQKYFYGVAQGVEKVQAFEAALQSAEQALLSIRKGAQAGTHTLVDVLNALQRVAETTRALAQARYEFLLNRLRLAAAAGQLDDELFAKINSSLGQP